eukprot:6904110-Prymnesium_polylepis.1
MRHVALASIHSFLSTALPAAAARCNPLWPPGARMSDYSKWDGIQDPDDEPDATLLPAREPVQGPRRKPGRPGGKALPTWAG